jgi:16S rRNA (uracil1498-N3)-methyltransferase
MQRYFIKSVTPESKTFRISDENLHHMLNVMRMKEGDKAILVFEDEEAIVSKISSIEEDGIFYEKVEQLENQVELPVNITIASAFPKGDKIEWITQKSTELGAHSFLFFPSEWSVAKWDDKKRKKKIERLEKIAQEAAEQSHRTHRPEVKMCKDIKEFLNECANYQHILIAYEETAKAGDKSALLSKFESIAPGENVLVIFGPEGGLAPKEVESFVELGGVPLALGARILRCETAPLYLLSSASFYFELKG